MTAPVRVGRQPEKEAVPVEIPQPILWNIANARSELIHARTARAKMTRLDPTIEQLEKDLAKLKGRHRDLGEVETLHMFNAKLSHQMADATAESGRYPRPQPFEEMEKEAAAAPIELPAESEVDALVTDGDVQQTRPFVAVDEVA
jgi:hypothetical protein